MKIAGDNSPAMLTSRRRFFVLESDNYLRYFKDESCFREMGSIDLTDISCINRFDNEFQLVLAAGNKVKLRAEKLSSVDSWIKAMVALEV